MHRPLVSVLIPTHDRPRWMATALDSAVSQRWEPLEIIVSDDGDLAATADVVASHADDPRVRFVRGAAEGIAANHRRALEVARGELVVFLSDDDRIAPEFVTRRAEPMAADPEAVVVFSGYRVCDETLVPVRLFDPPLPSDRVLETDALVDAALARHWSINSSMYRRDAVRRAWPDEALVGPAFDMALHLRLALTAGAHGWFGHWCDVDYRLHEGQTSRGDAVLRHFEAGARMYAYMLGQPMRSRARSRIARDCADWHVQWGRALAERGDLAEARRRMRRAVATAPRALGAWRQLAAAYVAPSRLLPRE